MKLGTLPGSDFVRWPMTARLHSGIRNLSSVQKPEIVNCSVRNIPPWKTSCQIVLESIFVLPHSRILDMSDTFVTACRPC